MITRATALDPWADVEYAILRAVQTPATCRGIAERTDLTPDVVKAQLAAYASEGLVTQPVPGTGRFQLTVAGFKRMFDLTDRPGQQSAA